MVKDGITSGDLFFLFLSVLKYFALFDDFDCDLIGLQGLSVIYLFFIFRTRYSSICITITNLLSFYCATFINN